MTAPDITSFLLARIADEEAAVERLLAYGREAYAHGLPPDQWSVTRRGEDDWEIVATAASHLRPKVVLDLKAWALTARPFMKHLERYDPARVLAECAALRKIVELHKPYEDVTGYRAGEPIREWLCPTCVWIGDDEDAGGNRFRDLEHETAPCDTLRLLTQPFAGHPHWRPEWDVD